MVFESLEDPAENIQSLLLLKIRKQLKKFWLIQDVEELALDDIAHNVHVQEWHKFLRGKLWWTDLHIAAATGQVGAIGGCLLERGALIESHDTFDRTPLHLASFRGHVGAIELLLARGARIEAQDDQGFTPLHGAAFAGKVAAIGCLLDRGARKEAHDGFDRTPLHRASSRGQVGAIELLLARGARIEAQDDQGCTPLHAAAATDQVGAIGLLLDRGAVIESQMNNGGTPLHAAAARGQERAIGLLLDRGASPAIRLSNKTPLMILALKNHLVCIREFISHVCLIPEPGSRELLTKTRYEMTQCMSIWKKYLKGRMPKELLLRILSSVKDAEGRDVFLPLVREVFRQRGYGEFPLVLRELLAEHLTGYTLENIPRLMDEAQGEATHDKMRALLDPHSVLMYGSELLQNIRKRCGVHI